MLHHSLEILKDYCLDLKIYTFPRQVPIVWKVVRVRNLPENFNQWDIKDKNGRSVLEEYLANKKKRMILLKNEVREGR